mmetsp:Transcript_32387/g.60880  ORF Transcript_32387/g.60880 Transcript_32387/m.60880 type:complete len:101 (+) Transcript_32387:369-671(+)
MQHFSADACHVVLELETSLSSVLELHIMDITQNSQGDLFGHTNNLFSDMGKSQTVCEPSRGTIHSFNVEESLGEGPKHEFASRLHAIPVTAQYATVVTDV